jgi:hypothetical protein
LAIVNADYESVWMMVAMVGFLMVVL